RGYAGGGGRGAGVGGGVVVQGRGGGERPPRLRGCGRGLQGEGGTRRPARPPPPPVMIGGGGEKVLLRLVARHADMWNNGGELAEFERKLDVLRRHCEREKRDFASIEKSWFGNVIVDSDPARARTRLERTAAAWGLSPEQMA